LIQLQRIVTVRLSIVAFVVLWSTACGIENRLEATPSQVPLIASTLSPTLSSPLSETSLPSSLQPMETPAPPVEGTTLTQVNVRAEPSTVSNVLGVIPANTRVEITGKDIGESWWQINYPQGVDGKGWVTAQYVSAANPGNVPPIGDKAADPHRGNVAVIQQQLNVRSGPGTGFNSLGILNPQDVVNLTGKDPNGAWLQIEFGSGPEGKGWVNSAFVQAQGVEELPIITEEGQIIGTGTPTGIPPTPTPTLVPAREDHDSRTSPIASVLFETSGTQTLIYNGDLSFPQGDPEDWIAFRPNGPLIFASLTCTGSASLNLEIIADTQPVSSEIACNGQIQELVVKAGSNYLVHLQATSTNGNLQYINYVLTITAKR
jgi:uncharacterized protein YraI